MDELMRVVADEVVRFRGELAERPVTTSAPRDDVRRAFAGPLAAEPTPARQVVEQLVAAARQGLMATPGPRFFGFVIGGALPAATAADMLAAGWDQCAFNAVLSPAASAAEETAGEWLKQLVGIPSSASVGFVTGAQAANTVGLACARHHVLAEAGWDVELQGL
jgi:glutamate/tyrosine decarboxylase-like PLP-dependent enzyme